MISFIVALVVLIIESVIALIWAAAGVAFYGGTEILNSTLSAAGQAGVSD